MEKEERVWSKQQGAIFKWMEKGTGNMVVRARAGTGKTTTILEGVGHAPESTILLCAFNKKIADELAARLAHREVYSAEAKTMHGVGYTFLRAAFNGIRVDKDRGFKAAEKGAPSAYKNQKQIISYVARLASLGKEVLPFAKGPTDLEPLAYEFDLIDARINPQDMSDWAYNVMQGSAQEDGTCDFSDMLWLPLKLKLAHGKYGMVVVDEAQDMNACQLELSLKVAKPGGRICVVGDDRQAIYSFRGADSASIDRLKGRLKAKELGLTTTYRCPRNVVDLASRIVGDFCAAPTAPDGKVSTVSEEKLTSLVQPKDFVLGRTNAYLMSTCLRLIREGVRARIEGKDIGKGLLALVRKHGKAGKLESMLINLDSWAGRAIERARSMEDEHTEQKIVDQVDTIKALAYECESIEELSSRLLELFSDSAEDKRPMVVLSTIHKAKGLEADRVFILNESFRHRGVEAMVPTDGEESNIWYVAITRAKKELTFVINPNAGKERDEAERE